MMATSGLYSDLLGQHMITPGMLAAGTAEETSMMRARRRRIKQDRVDRRMLKEVESLYRAARSQTPLNWLVFVGELYFKTMKRLLSCIPLNGAVEGLQTSLNQGLQSLLQFFRVSEGSWGSLISKMVRVSIAPPRIICRHWSNYKKFSELDEMLDNNSRLKNNGFFQQLQKLITDIAEEVQQILDGDILPDHRIAMVSSLLPVKEEDEEHLDKHFATSNNRNRRNLNNRNEGGMSFGSFIPQEEEFSPLDDDINERLNHINLSDDITNSCNMEQEIYYGQQRRTSCEIGTEQKRKRGSHHKFRSQVPPIINYERPGDNSSVVAACQSLLTIYYLLIKILLIFPLLIINALLDNTNQNKQSLNVMRIFKFILKMAVEEATYSHEVAHKMSLYFFSENAVRLRKYRTEDSVRDEVDSLEEIIYQDLTNYEEGFIERTLSDYEEDAWVELLPSKRQYTNLKDVEVQTEIITASNDSKNPKVWKDCYKETRSIHPVSSKVDRRPGRKLGSPVLTLPSAKGTNSKINPTVKPASSSILSKRPSKCASHLNSKRIPRLCNTKFTSSTNPVAQK